MADLREPSISYKYVIKWRPLPRDLAASDRQIYKSKFDNLIFFLQNDF